MPALIICETSCSWQIPTVKQNIPLEAHHSSTVSLGAIIISRETWFLFGAGVEAINRRVHKRSCWFKRRD